MDAAHSTGENVCTGPVMPALHADTAFSLVPSLRNRYPNYCHAPNDRAEGTMPKEFLESIHGLPTSHKRLLRQATAWPDAGGGWRREEVKIWRGDCVIAQKTTRP